MSAHVDEKGIVTFSTLAVKRSILEQIEIREIKAIRGAQEPTAISNVKLIGYTSEEWFLYVTEDTNKIFRMRGCDVQALMWQQLSIGLSSEEYKSAYARLTTELKTRWAELRSTSQQVFVC